MSKRALVRWKIKFYAIAKRMQNESSGGRVGPYMGSHGLKARAFMGYTREEPRSWPEQASGVGGDPINLFFVPKNCSKMSQK